MAHPGFCRGGRAWDGPASSLPVSGGIRGRRGPPCLVLPASPGTCPAAPGLSVVGAGILCVFEPDLAQDRPPGCEDDVRVAVRWPEASGVPGGSVSSTWSAVCADAGVGGWSVCRPVLLRVVSSVLLFCCCTRTASSCASGIRQAVGPRARSGDELRGARGAQSAKRLTAGLGSGRELTGVTAQPSWDSVPLSLCRFPLARPLPPSLSLSSK